MIPGKCGVEDPENNPLRGHMKDQKQPLKDTLRHIGFRTIAVALCVFLITVTMTAFIANRVYATEKTMLQQQGELNAKEAAMEYDECLLTRVNIVTVVGYAVDQMLVSGRGTDVIEKYLTEETSYISATLDPSTTGLYGWISGEYLDGSGWVPDADYVAVERPWYIQTRSSGEKITFVEPYVDMQTNDVMMTVSTLLNDGESVVAMDVSLDRIQRIVEQLSSDTEGGEAFVLDGSGIVVAHSDKTQLGKNYLQEADTLGGAFAVGIANRGMGERLIHRLFEHLGEAEIPELGDKKISISVGAVLTAGGGADSFDSLYAKVDNAMYVSKKSPGNCLTFAE